MSESPLGGVAFDDDENSVMEIVPPPDRQSVNTRRRSGKQDVTVLEGDGQDWNDMSVEPPEVEFDLIEKIHGIEFVVESLTSRRG